MKKIVWSLFLTLVLIAADASLMLDNNQAQADVPGQYNRNYGQPANKMPVKKISGVKTSNPANMYAKYVYYIPANLVGSKESYPVIVFVPGLGGNPNFCIPPEFIDIANKHGFGVISPDFKFNDQDFVKEQSFQYPAAWSGDALVAMCEQAKQQGLNYSKLYLVGFSAGAQFVSRFSLLRPELIDACAVLSSGARVVPTTRNDIKYFVGIGSYDVERIDNAEAFANGARRLGMYVEYKKYPQGHRPDPAELTDVANFFVKVKNKAI